MTTTVVNKHTHVPTVNDVYIGRPSKWGNPFTIGKHGDRAAVLKAYEHWLFTSNEGETVLYHVTDLKGKTLVCWCAPNTCHGHILAELADDPDTSDWYGRSEEL